MKQETKDLLTWIENALNSYASEKNNMITRDKCNKALAFLNSLPEIESHLCRGGYVQDRNGTPCCDGDVIINECILDKQKEKGILYWSKNDSRFYFKKADGLLHSLSVNFKKVEK